MFLPLEKIIKCCCTPNNDQENQRTYKESRDEFRDDYDTVNPIRQKKDNHLQRRLVREYEENIEINQGNNPRNNGIDNAITVYLSGAGFRQDTGISNHVLHRWREQDFYDIYANNPDFERQESNKNNYGTNEAMMVNVC